MANHMKVVEFDTILQSLSELALSERAKERALALSPTRSVAELAARQRETTGARAILESQGTPPLTPMRETRVMLSLAEAGAMLGPEQLTGIASFLNTCARMKRYLKNAEAVDDTVAPIGLSLMPLPEVYEEIDRSIRGEEVDDQASPELRSLRRKIESAREGIREKLESILRAKRDWFSDSFIVSRGGRFALPVKKAYRGQVPGTVVDISGSGGTVFIEPQQARRLTDALSELVIAEENEVRRILYTLSALVSGHTRELLQNIECMEALDFAFAKARLSHSMQALEPDICTERRIRIVNGRLPLLEQGACVPLSFELGGGVRGVVITGPNTGGKTVAIKTVGLLSMMAQSGLHVPVEAGSTLAMHANILCDIGDGQSITENLSTFSSHMTNIIGILAETTHESLVLLDELGSGTDPAEGMGLAVAILEELRGRGCLFVSTSHYPEIKEYAARADGLTNARMTFDRESLQPLYALEMGEAGESCALHIAKRLGFPEHMLRRATEAAYGGGNARQSGPSHAIQPEPDAVGEPRPPAKSAIALAAPKDTPPRRCDRFQVGDSVRVHPQRDLGIICRRADEKGMVMVQIKKQKQSVNHKRVELLVPADELYPEDYDFSIVFDTVANRKARRRLDKGNPDAVIRYEKGGEPTQW